MHLNGDNMTAFAAARGRGYFRDRYTIGYWFWELSKWRDDWLDGFNHVDEVWVASEFTRACLAEVSPVPVVVMPLPFVLPEPPPLGRAHFGLPEGRTIFLLTFDVSSQTERKNPLGAIRAFRRAALPRGTATLVLKYTNAEYNRDAVRRFHEEAEGLDVTMLDGYMSRPELTALMNAVGLLSVASPRRGVRHDDGRSDDAGEAGHRHELLRQRRFHDAGQQLSRWTIASCR